MTIKHMLNPSTGRLENMTQRVCPVCHGHGRTIHDPDAGLTAARRTVFY